MPVHVINLADMELPKVGMKLARRDEETPAQGRMVYVVADIINNIPDGPFMKLRRVSKAVQRGGQIYSCRNWTDHWDIIAEV